MKATKDFYLDGLRRMDWDIFRFGSYNMKNWHYDEVVKFLDRIEQGKFPVDEWAYEKVDGKLERSGKITLGLDNVEEYIDFCHRFYIDLNLERLFEADCREDMRHGIVLIDCQRMTVAEARAYVEQKITKRLQEIYNFTL